MNQHTPQQITDDAGRIWTHTPRLSDHYGATYAHGTRTATLLKGKLISASGKLLWREGKVAA